jgi:DMSO reductase family type II enzyme heme b subunit
MWTASLRQKCRLPHSTCCSVDATGHSGGTDRGHLRHLDVLKLVVVVVMVAALFWNTAVLAEDVAVRAKLKDQVPTDPLDPVWNTIPGTEFPVSPQVHWQKRIQQVTVKSIKVRGVHNTKQIAFLLEYADPTQDPADGAAVEFMVGDKKAHFAHGQPMLQVEGGPVNIWYWRNDTPGAADMTAMGFGTLKKQAQQDVQAKAVWKDEKTKVRYKQRSLILRKDAKGEQIKDPKTGDPLFDEETKQVEEDVTGVWRVVFVRNLSTTDSQDAQFQPGIFPNIAFAVWDGHKLESGDVRESGSQKGVTSWWYFTAEPAPDYSIYLYGLVAVVVAAGVEYVIIRKVRKGQPT